MIAPRDLSVASYNIHKGIGTDRPCDLSRTVQVISEIGADILALQEADTSFGTRTGQFDLESIRRDLRLIAVPLDGVGDAHGWHGNLLCKGPTLKALGEQFSIADPRPSFPSRYPLLAFDRMITCTQGELLEIATHDSPPARRASDHLPIAARLRLVPQTAEGQ